MRALVTGGGGFLGLYIVEQLVARGDAVQVLCRGSYPSLAELGVECIAGDVRDAQAVEAACAGIDTVFHVAAVSGIWGPWEHYHGINTLGTKNVIAGCRKHAVPRLVYTSSPSVVYDGNDHCDADESLPYPMKYLCHYPHSKALAEQAVLGANDAHLATAALRPHLIWGPRDNHLIPRLIERARSGKLRPDEYQGGTFTVSNMGMYGVESFTAIINPPSVSIVAVSAVARRPDFDAAGDIVPRSVLKLTVGSDHRVVNGAENARYLAEVKRLLEHPLLLTVYERYRTRKRS